MIDVVGYLVEGKFVCHSCHQLNLHVEGPKEPDPVRIESKNMGAYSQTCSACHKRKICGKWSTELFPVDPDQNEFRWVNMISLLANLDHYIIEDDREAIWSTKRELYERILKAIMADKLHDRELVFQALRKVIQQ